MKWQGRRQSSNVDDRRGQSGPSRGFGGFSPMLMGPLIKILFSKVGLVIAGLFIVVSFITGNNPLTLLSGLISGNGSQQVSSSAYQGTDEENELADFSATILASTEDVWNEILDNYREPTLVLFTGSVSSACGSASSATGPFYCPGDEKLYIDLSFFHDMEQKLNAPGDFAQAYVIAHEVGHHVQKLMGLTDKVHKLRGQVSETEYNKYSVMLELQADFFAGVWANRSESRMSMMEEGDLEEALNAANAIGDDRLQKQSSGRVVPDSFTHGTSEQRVRWFKKGFETGDIAQGDTFNAKSL
ncbi:KPN_02809 family neutral zinc metallopeptidase [Cyclobacterium amurskyense]|uniref:YpfJ protein, zinc metalloprotease superfamily n=1 Tax=Cyclobacterium amurskyense TaxID=320787 RepID=A0A0H4PFN6_9BACT|nr:neutral zinc metallopeptidase [Cyclobacterium amurskyense]AKP53296.1 YpfJ protein, zinc metalloprotease superfamily [Cyclobacterium amurskyense]|tara:strand:- start:8668 stop:9567 length:900 start_codon:yes stop_codon:yes gene_type:complete